MNHIRTFWNRLLPAVTANAAASDGLARGRASLVIATGLGLAGAIAARPRSPAGTSRCSRPTFRT